MSVIRRNVVWLLLSQGATWVVSIITMIIVPPLLGERGFGELAFVAAYAAIFELLAIFGTGRYLIKTVSRDPAARGRFVYNALALKLLMSVLAGLLAAGVGLALGFSHQRMTLVAVFNVGMVLGVLNNVVLSGLHGTQEMGRPALWDVVQKYVGAALGIVILLAGGGLTAYAIAGVWAISLPLIANTWGMRRDLSNSGGIDLSVWRLITYGGAPFFALAALNLLQGAIDVPMLEGLAGTEPVGWYTLAIRWVSMPSLLAVVVATAFFPALSAEGATVNQAFTSMANRCLHLVSLLAIPASVGIALIAGRFIDLLYGGEFAEAVPLMRLLSLEIPIAGINVVLAVVIVAADRQRQWVLVALIAAIFNPVTNFFAIPWAIDRFENGAIGAAMTTVLTELIMFAGAVKVSPPGVFGTESRRLVLRIVLASSTMIPVVLLLQDVPLLVTVTAAAVVYVACSFALGTISTDYVRQLRGQLRRRRQIEPETSDNESGSPL